MKLFEEKLSRREIFNGRVLHVHEDEIRLPDGSTSRREIIDHTGGVCVGAFDSQGRLAFVRQYRYAYGEVVLELPAGKLEKDENPDLAIARELEEEVGAHGSDWQSLGRLYPSPGYTNEIIYLYTCRIDSLGQTHTDDDEFLESEFIPLDKAVDMVLGGEIYDAKTQTIILKLAQLKALGRL